MSLADTLAQALIIRCVYLGRYITITSPIFLVSLMGIYVYIAC